MPIFYICACLAALATAATAAEPAARPRPRAAALDIREWPVPWKDTGPRDPFMDADGRVWFVGQKGDYVAHLDPATGTFTRVELEEGTGPHNVIVDGRDVWFSGNRKAYIGRLNPATGEIRKYPMLAGKAEDPHTLAMGAGGRLWFTAQMSNAVGTLDTRTGDIRLVDLPSAGSRPYGMVVDPKGRPWFDEFGSDTLGTVDPTTLELVEYPLAQAGTRPRRIGLTSDGGVWYTDYARGRLGRLDDRTGKVREWVLPGGEQSLPYAMAVDDKDRIWAVETGPQPNVMVGFDPKAQRVFASAAIPSGGGTVRHMVFVPRTREIWFGTDKGTIGRLKVP
jgi:virginiamycin B lyase